MNSTEKEIYEYQTKLNAEDVLPPQAFRRDKFSYPFVSFVNNVTGCYLSKNYKPIPIFIERALNEAQQNYTDIKTYKSVAFEYFKLIIAYMIEKGIIKKDNVQNLLRELNECH